MAQDEIFDRQSNRGGFHEFFEGDWSRSARRDRVGQAAQLLEMALVRFAAAPQRRTVAGPGEFPEIVNDVRLAVAEDGDVFLCEAALRSKRRVSEAGDRAILVRDRG